MGGSLGRQSIDEFLKSHQAQGDSTITAPPQGPQPGAYIDSVMGGAPGSYIDSVMSQGQEPSLIPLLQEAPKPEGRDWAAIAIGGMKAFKAVLEDQGKNLSQYSKYFNESYASPEWFSGTLMRHDQGTSQQTDLALAAQGDPAAQERIRRGKEGEALAVSSAAAEFTAAGLAARGFAQGVKAGVLKKGIAWLTAQEAGAGAYAATAPPTPGETRLETFERVAWQFPATAAVLHGLGKSLGFVLDRVFPKIDPKISGPLQDATPEQAADIATGAREYARQVGPVPAAHAEDVAAEGVARATKDVLRLGMPADEQMARNWDMLRRGEGRTHPDETVRAAALAEQMRGRPFTRVEFDSFIKDFGEDGPYMAMRKWAEPPGPPRTSATAKTEAGVPEGPPDFTVEGPEAPPPPPEPAPLPKTPPPKGPLGMEPLPGKPAVEDIPPGISPRPGLREDLGTPSEAELQQELETLVPKPKARGETDAEARARVEEARTTPFPGTKEPPWAPLSQEASPPAAEPPAPKARGRKAPKGTPLIDAYVRSGKESIREILQEYTGGYELNKQSVIRRIANHTIEQAGEIGAEPPYEAVTQELEKLSKKGPGPIESPKTPEFDDSDLWQDVPATEDLPQSSSSTAYTEERARLQALKLRDRYLQAPPIEGTPYRVESTSLPPELSAKIGQRWYAKDLTNALGVLQERLVRRLRQIIPVPSARFSGFVVESQLLGANLDVDLANTLLKPQAGFPFKENSILFNLYATFRDMAAKKIPLGQSFEDVLAESTHDTMVHEVAHQLVNDEGPEHIAMMRKILDLSMKNKDAEVQSIARIWRQIIRDAAFNRDYMEVLDAWEGSKLAKVKESVLSGLQGGQRGDLLGGAEGGDQAGINLQTPENLAQGGGGGGTGLQGPVESGSAEPPGDYASTFGNRPYAGGEDLEGLLAKRQHNPDLVPQSAIADAANEEAIKSMTPEEMLGPQEKAEAANAVSELPHEPSQRQPLTYLRQVGDEPAGPEMDSEPGAKSDETLHTEQQKGEDFWRSEEGAASRKIAVRLSLLGLSGLSEYAAEQTDDPDKKAYLRWTSRFLAAGVVAEFMGSKGVKAWIQRPIPLRATGKSFAPLYGFVRSFDGPRIMTDGSVKAMDQWHAMTSWGRSGAEFLRRTLEPHFPDVQTREAGMYSIDEGRAAPEWHTLNAQAQSEVLATNHLNGQMILRMEAVGAIPVGSGRAWYISKLFADRETAAEWFEKWKNIVQFSTPTAAQTFATVRAAVNWAQTMGRDLPVMDPAKAQPHFMEEVSRQLANHAMTEGFKSTGVLVPFDRTRILNQSPNLALMFRLRQVKVPGLGPPQMATDEAATLLERAYGSKEIGGALAAIDKARGVMMRSIMFWAWEHGINGARAALAVTMNPLKYLDSIKAVKAMDPAVMEMSKFSNPFQRSDWGLQAQTEFDKLMENATAKFSTKFPTLGRIGASIEHWRAGSERYLWNVAIPAIGHLAWTQEMNGWVNRTGGKYLVGSPEYNAFAKRVGEFADDAMGKVPKLLVDPRVAFATRQALFSPNWTRTRINMSLKAGVEGVRILSGELEPQDALYLPFKLRSVLIGTALTVIGSLVLTGIHALVTGRGKPELPQFNPNTNKFYMRTGMYDRSNREIGFDMAGWYQDDTKMYNDPLAYLRDRQNPLLRTITTTLTGRDVFGRTIEGVGRLDQILGGLGPPGDFISSAGKMIAGNTEPGDLLRAGTGLAAVGNVSALPTMADVNANRAAVRILEDQGLPTDKDRVYQLSTLLKRNVAQHTRPYEGDVPFWIASQKRQYQRTGWPYLWDQKKRDLRELLTK